MGIWQSRSLSPLGDQILSYYWQTMQHVTIFSRGRFGALLCNYTQDPKCCVVQLYTRFKGAASQIQVTSSAQIFSTTFTRGAGGCIWYLVSRWFDSWQHNVITQMFFLDEVVITLCLRWFLPNVRAVNRRSRRVLLGGMDMAQLDWFRTMRGFCETLR